MFSIIPKTLQPELEKIKYWATAASKTGQESCGFIVNGESVLEKNAHNEPEDNFRLVNFLYPRSDISAIWHSHWKDSHSGGLSFSDITVSNEVKIPIIVYHPGFDIWDYYEPNNPNPWPLTPISNPPTAIDFYFGWRFEWGRSDCFSLVRRYYLGKLGIEIGEFPRPEVAPAQLHSLGNTWSYKDYWNKNNDFVVMPPGTTPQLHDVFGIALRGGKEANHLAVLAIEEANLILHNLGSKMKSRLDIFDAAWRNLVVPQGHGRHKSLC
ncbi:MAG: hypothetical protein V7L23_15325 [Nostoc sp.]|uniref:hypothetical protein n=1 Tax=Nostoc sp. TaxID=1180 RepID=UPI002FF3053F